MNHSVEVLPQDEHNKNLVSHVHPPDWVSPEPAPRYNLVVIGGGSAGLVTAIGAAGLGAKVALVERHLLGGDCLNVGCVPSKCIIRSSRAIADVRSAHEFGIRTPDSVEADFGAVMERMRRLRSGIAPHDSAKRFQEAGVDIFLGQAEFTSSDTIQVDGTKLRFKKAVIATGGRATHPPIQGLAEAGFLTNETVFSLTERPKRLAVIGGGPIGCELAQAFRRLGSEVSLFEMGSHILGREDPDAAAIVQEAFVREGVQLHLNSRLQRVTKTDQGKVLCFETDGKAEEVAAGEILVSAGRAPNVDGLNLETVGVDYDKQRGVHVDDTLRTTNRRIFAAGDVCMKYKFTHTADAAARIVIQNALFGGKKRVSRLVIPWCTYTDPEIAHVGMYERDAQEQGIEVDTFTREMSDVDRSIAEGDTEGFVRVHVRKGSDKILGATIVARHAGDMISEITLAMVGGIGLGKIASVIHPYPTQAEAIKQTADAYSRTRLTPTVKKLFNTWLRWTR